jgi:hypothetical protein
MNFVTRTVTTHLVTPFPLQYHGLNACFPYLYKREGDIYGAYCHQNTYKALISLLKEPVFVVVTKVVTLFEEVNQ